MSLKYDNFRFSWTVVTKLRLNSIVYACKGTYLCSGILNDKSAYSLAINIFKK